MGVARKPKAGRVIRRYRRNIPAGDSKKWEEQIRGSEGGYGLYALYRDRDLVYVGIATKRSIRNRIRTHRGEKKKDFTHFSVFLVQGKSKVVRERRIRDLEALILHILVKKPEYNLQETNFVGAKKLEPKVVSK
jgi:hypothetical protein